MFRVKEVNTDRMQSRKDKNGNPFLMAPCVMEDGTEATIFKSGADNIVAGDIVEKIEYSEKYDSSSGWVKKPDKNLAVLEALDRLEEKINQIIRLVDKNSPEVPKKPSGKQSESWEKARTKFSGKKQDENDYESETVPIEAYEEG